MPRVIKSPVKRWEGTITLCDPLTIEQVMSIEDALDAGVEAQPSKFLGAMEGGKADITWSSREDHLFIPVIQLCVKSWDLTDFPADIFPATPRNDSHLLVRTIWNELLKIYQGERDVPNE